MSIPHLLAEFDRAAKENRMREFVARHRGELTEDALSALREHAFSLSPDGRFDEDRIRAFAALLLELGAYDFAQKNFAPAERFYDEAAELVPAFQEPRVSGTVLSNLALTQYHLAKHAAAISNWEKAIALLKSSGVFTEKTPEFLLPGGEKISWIEMLRYLGAAYDETGQQERTKAYWQQALRLARAAGLEEAVGWIITDFGSYHRKHWNLREALHYDERALEFHQRSGNKRHQGMVLGFMGLSYSYLGPYDQALDYYNRALANARERNDKKEERNCLGNLGRVYAVSGRREKALEIFLAACELEIDDAEQDAATLLLLEASLGNVYRELGQHEHARQFYTQALERARARQDRKMENRLMSSLGIVHRDLEQLEQAQQRFHASCALAEACKDDLGRSDALGNLGNVLYQRGRVAEAEPYYREALKLAEKLHDVLFASRWRGNLANVYHALGRHHPAEENYKAALALAESNHDLDHVYLWNYNLGSLYRRVYQEFEQAYGYYQAAIVALETVRREIRTEDFSRAYGESKVAVYHDLVNLCLQGEEHKAEALNYAERAKGHTLMRMMAEAHVQPSEKVPEEIRRKYVKLREEQLHLEAQLAGIFSPEERIASKPAEHLTEQLAERDRIYAAQSANLREIEKYQPEFAHVFHAPSLAIADVQAHLKEYQEKTVLIEFFVTEQKTNVFLLCAEEWQVLELSTLTESGLQKFMEEDWLGPYRRFLSRKEPLSFWQENIKSSMKKLHGLLWEEVQTWLDKIQPQRLLIVPHLGLHLLPLHLLPLASSEKEAPESPLVYHCLLERYEISYAPSFRMLTYCRNAERSQRKKENLLALGNPDGTLRFAEIEATAIAALFAETRVLTRHAAKRAALLDAAQEHDFIHLATHGTGATLLKDSLAAGLKLAEDEFLTAREIFKMLKVPRAYAVVLSACETGMIRLDQSDEYIGLPAAFLYAGAPAVVSSLWQVDDLATALLLYRWYKHVRVEKMGRAAALKHAQLEVRDLTVAELLMWLHEVENQFARRQTEAGSNAKSASYAIQLETVRAQIAQYEKNYSENRRSICPFSSPWFWGGFILSGNAE